MVKVFLPLVYFFFLLFSPNSMGAEDAQKISVRALHKKLIGGVQDVLRKYPKDIVNDRSALEEYEHTLQKVDPRSRGRNIDIWFKYHSTKKNQLIAFKLVINESDPYKDIRTVQSLEWSLLPRLVIPDKNDEDEALVEEDSEDEEIPDSEKEPYYEYFEKNYRFEGKEPLLSFQAGGFVDKMEAVGDFTVKTDESPIKAKGKKLKVLQAKFTFPYATKRFLSLLKVLAKK